MFQQFLTRNLVKITNCRNCQKRRTIRETLVVSNVVYIFAMRFDDIFDTIFANIFDVKNSSNKMSKNFYGSFVISGLHNMVKITFGKVTKPTK